MAKPQNSTQLTFIITAVIFVIGVVVITLLAQGGSGPSGPVQNTSDWIKGAGNAQVEIIIFSDFQCPGCKAEAPVLDQVLSAYPEDVKVNYKHFLIPSHTLAPFAAEAAEAAGNQNPDKFWEMHDLIFANQETLERSSFDQFASQIGLDMEKFQREMKERTYKSDVDADVQEGNNLNVSATPTIIINGRMLDTSGQIPTFEALQQEIDSILITNAT